jgi:heme exporter protein A
MMQITAQSVGKNFGDKKIFKNINFNINDGDSLAITGPNGSGKTTLVRILCGLIRPSEGEIQYYAHGSPIAIEEIYQSIGLVGPYLELYEELTAIENLRFFAKMRDLKNAEKRCLDLLNRLGLDGREDDPVKNYSSGMRQRLKYVFALLHTPHILILDEPTSNLDANGIETVYRIMDEQKQKNILIIATNDTSDLKFGDQQLAISS